MEKKPIHKTSTVDLIKELSKLENEVNMKIMQYNKAIELEEDIINGIARYNVIVKELVQRFPFLKEDSEFQIKDETKEKKKGKFKLL